jgi:glutathione S-transferase
MIAIVALLAFFFAVVAHGEMKIVLWNSGTCPYAQRAWIALEEKGVPFEHKIINLQDKPAAFLDKYAAAVSGDRSIRPKVPLLEYGDTLVVESADVIKLIGVSIDDDSMYPVSNQENLDRVDRFLSVFESVIQSYYQYLTAHTESQAEAGKRAFCESLFNLEEQIEGPFCLGKTFSVAECYAAPWVHRFVVTIPYFRGAHMPELIRPGSKVAAWIDAVLCRPSVQATSCPEDYLLKSTRSYFVKYVTPGAPGCDEEIK